MKYSITGTLSCDEQAQLGTIQYSPWEKIHILTNIYLLMVAKICLHCFCAMAHTQQSVAALISRKYLAIYFYRHCIEIYR